MLSSCITVKLRTGDTYYEQHLFDKAIPYYQQVISKKYSDDLLIKLAECYRNVKNYQQTEVLYGKITALRPDPDYQYFYAEALMQNGKYNEAKKWFQRYLITNRSDVKALNLLASCDSIEELFKDSTLFNIKLLPFNKSNESNFSPVYYRSGIVYVSNRNPDEKTLRSKPVLEDYNLFYALRTELGNWLEPEALRGNINSVFNEGPCTFNRSFMQMYVTRNDNEGKKIVTNQKSENVLKIYQGATTEGEWHVTGEWPYNNHDYSVGHPSLSPSGKTMVFVSDMPWGYGGTDLYKSENINGTWTKPVNLGKLINSSGNEMFPYLMNDSVLYYSSDGMIGLGGLDVYRSEILQDEWIAPENMGYPVNSSKDDFGFICDSLETSGFISSNRLNNNDKIFAFTKNAPVVTLTGKLMEKANGKPIKNAVLKLKCNEKDTVLTTNEDGTYGCRLLNNMDYKIEIEEKNFFATSVTFNTRGYRKSADIEQNISLEKLVYNKPLQWRAIAFDKGSAVLKAETKAELNKLYAILIQNKGIKIELSCHTDVRGNEKENLILSQNRADAAAEYLFGKGISRERIVAVGYGSQKLLNNCTKNVFCLEEEHLFNIRTEIKYLLLSK
jgi:outer membrane protein OmpA-like peptidoglycan-associated protein